MRLQLWFPAWLLLFKLRVRVAILFCYRKLCFLKPNRPGLKGLLSRSKQITIPLSPKLSQFSSLLLHLSLACSFAFSVCACLWLFLSFCFHVCVCRLRVFGLHCVFGLGLSYQVTLLHYVFLSFFFCLCFVLFYHVVTLSCLRVSRCHVSCHVAFSLSAFVSEVENGTSKPAAGRGKKQDLRPKVLF